MLAFIKNIIFLASYAAVFYAVWLATRKLSEHYGRELDWLAMLGIVLPVTGLIGWLIFTIYFYLAIVV